MKILITNKKYYKVIVAITLTIILFIFCDRLIKSKKLTISKGKDIAIPFQITSSAIKGVRLYLEPGNLKSVDQNATVTFSFEGKNNEVGDISNPNSMVWGIPKEGISIIDLRRPLLLDGELNSWAIHSSTDNNRVKFKVWREENDSWVCVGESEEVVLKKGINSYDLEKGINVKKGDYLGFYTADGSISLQSGSSGAWKVYYLGDVKKGVKTSGIRDNEAGYCIKAYYVPKNIATFNINGYSLREGYYSFFSQNFYKFKGSVVNVVIASNLNDRENNMVSVLPRLKNGIFSDTGNFYILPVYSVPASATEGIEYTSHTNDYFYLFFNFMCILLLLGSFVLI